MSADERVCQRLDGERNDDLRKSQTSGPTLFLEELDPARTWPDQDLLVETSEVVIKIKHVLRNRFGRFDLCVVPCSISKEINEVRTELQSPTPAPHEFVWS